MVTKPKVNLLGPNPKLQKFINNRHNFLLSLVNNNNDNHYDNTWSIPPEYSFME